MKKIIIAAASVFLVCGTANAAGNEVGRWQLFQGEYPQTNATGVESQVRALFKIDTVTGDIYECSAGVMGEEITGKSGVVTFYQGCRPFEDIEIPIN